MLICSGWLCNNKILQGIQIRMNSPLKGEGGFFVCQPINEPCVVRLLLRDELILSICRCWTAGRLTLASTKACESDRRESVMLLVPFNLPQSSLPFAKKVLVGVGEQSVELGDAHGPVDIFSIEPLIYSAPCLFSDLIESVALRFNSLTWVFFQHALFIARGLSDFSRLGVAKLYRKHSALVLATFSLIR